MLYVYGAMAGVVAGGSYALVALSITLMYRSTGVLSFAHAAFATVSAYVFADLTAGGWPKALAFLVAIAISGGYAMIVERVAIRPVAGAPSTVKLIVTLGIVSITSAILLLIYGFRAPAVVTPLLVPQGSIPLGELRVSYQELTIFGIGLAVALGLAWFLDRRPFGVAIQAVAQDAPVARLMGISTVQVARFNWGLGGVLAGVAGVLIAPFTTLNVAIFTILVVKAMTASLVGGLASLPLTFLGGLVVGVVESETTLLSTTPGSRELVVLLLVVLLLVVRKPGEVDLERGYGAFGLYTPSRLATASARLRDAVRERAEPLVGTARQRVLPVVSVARTPFLILASAMLLLPARSEYWGFIGARALIYLIVALSLVLLVGWAGQVSIMHGAYVGVGAYMTSYLVDTRGFSLEVAIPLAVLVGVLMGLLVGVPALRLTGLQFAIASIVVSTAASSWLFLNRSFTGRLPRGSLFGVDLFDSGNLYAVLLPVTGVLYLVAWNLRRSTYGSLVIAARDAAGTVDHFGVRASLTRVATFALASLMATLGGAFYGLLLTGFSPIDFSIALSISFLLYAVVGGITSLAGPAIAALLFGALPAVIQGQSTEAAVAVPELVSGILVIALLAFRPGGLASFLVPERRRTVAVQAKPVTRLRASRFEQVMRQGPGLPGMDGSLPRQNESEAERSEATGVNA